MPRCGSRARPDRASAGQARDVRTSGCTAPGSTPLSGANSAEHLARVRDRGCTRRFSILPLSCRPARPTLPAGQRLCRPLWRDHARMQHRIASRRIFGQSVQSTGDCRAVSRAGRRRRNLSVRADVRDIGQRFVAETAFAMARAPVFAAFRRALRGTRSARVANAWSWNTSTALVFPRGSRQAASSNVSSQRDRARLAEENPVQATERDRRHGARAP
jgi:hypothetical protein